MKHIIVLAVVLCSTAAKAEWTPGTVLLVQFQQELYTAQPPKDLTTAVMYSHIKSQLSALIVGPWSKPKENRVLP